MSKKNPTYNIRVCMVAEDHYEAVVAELDITVTAETFQKVMLEVERAIVVHLMEKDKHDHKSN